MKYFTRIGIAIAILIPITALAHVKWFTEHSETQMPLYSFDQWPVWIGIVMVLAIVAIASKLEKTLHVPRGLQSHLNSWRPFLLSVADVGIGLSLLIFTTQGFVFAPNLMANDGFSYALLVLQAVIGLSFLFGLYTRIGALLLMLLYVLASGHYGWLELVDAFEMLGFAFYGFIVGRPRFNLLQNDSLVTATKKIRGYGLPLLRVFSGLNLVILAFTEKLLRPNLGITFLQSRDWNFMQHLGFEWFSDYWFVFSAGVTEAIFGILLILGLITRTTTIALAVFLITTLILLGPKELIGHLPHFSLAIVLLILGSGSKLKLKP